MIVNELLLRFCCCSAGRIRAKKQFTAWTKIKKAYSSELIVVECNRVAERLRLCGEIDDADIAEIKLNLSVFFAGLTRYAVSNEVLTRAAQSFSTVIGTLDSIHLSTMLLVGEKHKVKQILATHDEQLATAARALGINVAGC